MKVILGIVALAALGLAFVGGSRQAPERLVADYMTSLRGRSQNQRHNAQLCADKLNGTVIEPGEVFSFNATVGPWSRDRGYRRAPVSYGGQLVDAWGGGVCQTSTTIYNAALLAGFDLLERHPHHFAPSYVEPGRDAAVGFPNIDLRFRNTLDVPVRLEVTIEQDRLRAAFVARGVKSPVVAVWTEPQASIQPQTINLSPESRSWVRNPGRPGYDVVTWRRIGDARQRLSHDRYPVMNRVLDGVEYR